MPVVMDGVTMLPFEPAGAGVFHGYLAELAPDGRAAMRMTLPPVSLPHPLVIYHAALLVPPSGPPWSTNTVRLVLR